MPPPRAPRRAPPRRAASSPGAPKRPTRPVACPPPCVAAPRRSASSPPWPSPPCCSACRARSSPSGYGSGPRAPAPTQAPTRPRLPPPRLRDPADYVLDAWDRATPPTTREFRWTIRDARLNPDGVFRPMMMLINGQFPGPLVECNDGDTLVVHVANRAAATTAIHFHGLFQNGSNLMDGAVGVTQCPIPAGRSMTYIIPVRGQAGTFWYHAHHAAHAADGLVGPVVVHAPDEPRYASDRVLMVHDHYHNASADLLVPYLGPDGQNVEPVPDSALINGRGLRACADFPGWPCDASAARRPVVDLAAGARHRLRFINAGAFAGFQLQLDEHPLYVAEVDATDVHPEPFHRLNILPAQRYSVLVDANATSADAFWLRARMLTRCFAAPNPRLDPEIRAVVRYRRPAPRRRLPRPARQLHDGRLAPLARLLQRLVVAPQRHLALAAPLPRRPARRPRRPRRQRRRLRAPPRARGTDDGHPHRRPGHQQLRRRRPPLPPPRPHPLRPRPGPQRLPALGHSPTRCAATPSPSRPTPGSSSASSSTTRASGPSTATTPGTPRPAC